MFDNQEPKKKPDLWFYATIIFAVIILTCFGAYALNHFNVISLSTLFVREMKVDGEIFVVTQGRENFKLALVEVCAIPEKKILDWIDAKETKAKIEIVKAKKTNDFARRERDSAKLETELSYQRASRLLETYFSSSGDNGYIQAKNQAERNAKILEEKERKLLKAQSDYLNWFSPRYYLDSLKDCEVSTKTNSDGKFSLTLKRDKYALAARSERKTIGDTEEYFWLIWVSPDSVSNKMLMLSNDNFMEANPQEKVVEIKTQQ